MKIVIPILSIMLFAGCTALQEPLEKPEIKQSAVKIQKEANKAKKQVEDIRENADRIDTSLKKEGIPDLVSGQTENIRESAILTDESLTSVNKEAVKIAGQQKKIDKLSSKVNELKRENKKLKAHYKKQTQKWWMMLKIAGALAIALGIGVGIFMKSIKTGIAVSASGGLLLLTASLWQMYAWLITTVLLAIVLLAFVYAVYWFIVYKDEVIEWEKWWEGDKKNQSE